MVEVVATTCIEKLTACGEFNLNKANLSANQKEGRLNVYLIGWNRRENNNWLQTNSFSAYFESWDFILSLFLVTNFLFS